MTSFDRRSLLSVLAGGAAASMMPGALAFAAPVFPGVSALSMDLYQGSKVIGQHAYEITGSQSAPRVRTTANFEGRILGFRFRYALSTEEVWQGGRLLSLRSEGSLRDQPFGMSADREGGALAVVDEKGRRYQADGGLLPTTYWMPNFVQQSAVLDTQRGGVLTTQPQALGKGTFYGRSVQGWDIGGDLPITIYYDDSGTWSGLKFSIAGARFQYRRV